MRKIAKGTADYFEKQLHKMLIDNFHVTIKSGNKMSYVFKTLAGNFEISLPSVQDYCFCVFGRFKDVDLAKLYLKGDSMFNEHSGKFNFTVGSVPKKDVPAIINAYKGVLKAMINHLKIVDKSLDKCSITNKTIVDGWVCTFDGEKMYFLNDEVFANYLRSMGADYDNDLSDDYLVREAYEHDGAEQLRQQVFKTK